LALISGAPAAKAKAERQSAISAHTAITVIIFFINICSFRFVLLQYNNIKFAAKNQHQGTYFKKTPQKIALLTN
jgi:hypothetical protein